MYHLDENDSNGQVSSKQKCVECGKNYLKWYIRNHMESIYGKNQSSRLI